MKERMRVVVGMCLAVLLQTGCGGEGDTAPENVGQDSADALDPRTQLLVDLFDNITDQELVDRTVLEIYAPEATFRDPVQKADNRDEIREVLGNLGQILEWVDTEILKDAVTEDTLAIHWNMTFKLVLWPNPIRVLGVTWMDLNAEGKCIAQVDYWDFAAAVLAALCPASAP